MSDAILAYADEVVDAGVVPVGAHGDAGRVGGARRTVLAGSDRDVRVAEAA